MDNVSAVVQFACNCIDFLDQSVCSGMLEACLRYSSWCLPKISESSLQGISAHAASMLCRSYSENPHLGRACDIVESFKFIQRWVRANTSQCADKHAHDNLLKDARTLISTLEIHRLPYAVLSDQVRPSGLLDPERLLDIYGAVIRSGKCGGTYAGGIVPLKKEASLSGDWVHYADECKHTYDPDSWRFEPKIVVSGGHGDAERLAVLDWDTCSVYVYSLQARKFLHKIGRQGSEPGAFTHPAGAVFNARGELFVSDGQLNTIQIFDGLGKFLRSFGKTGTGIGELICPAGMALGAQGEIIVCDQHNHRVQVFGHDGRDVLHVFGSKGVDDGQFRDPHAVAVLVDGSIVVADNDGVQVFTSAGTFLRRIMHARGEFVTAGSVCVGPFGEVVLTDECWGQIHVLDAEGVNVLCSMEESREESNILNARWSDPHDDDDDDDDSVEFNCHLCVDSGGRFVYTACRSAEIQVCKHA